MTSQRAKATRYILSLPIVRKANLPDNNQSCHICMEDFKAQTGHTLELPVRLPCSHILGTICMINWLSSNGNSSPRGCPLCRAELLPKALSDPLSARRRESLLGRIQAFDEVAYQRIVDLGRVRWPRREGFLPPGPPTSRPRPGPRPGQHAPFS